jgi:hypothetical protein
LEFKGWKVEKWTYKNVATMCSNVSKIFWAGLFFSCWKNLSSFIKRELLVVEGVLHTHMSIRSFIRRASPSLGDSILIVGAKNPQNPHFFGGLIPEKPVGSDPH